LYNYIIFSERKDIFNPLTADILYILVMRWYLPAAAVPPHTDKIIKNGPNVFLGKFLQNDILNFACR